MQAIQTKYLPARNTKGARIKAVAWAGQHTQAYDHSQNLEDNHLGAATALAEKFGWLEDHALHGGALVDNTMIWVLVPFKGE